MSTERKQKVGRKRASVAKGRILNVRLSDTEYDAVQAAAENAGMTSSAFFRSLMLDGAGVRPVFNPDDRLALAVLHEDMRKIGVNLNQVARALNSGRAIHPEEIKIALRNVQLATVAVSAELRQAAVRSGNRRRGSE